jgi:branched-chain amino acid transport system substrate-binding protein
MSGRKGPLSTVAVGLAIVLAGCSNSAVSPSAASTAVGSAPASAGESAAAPSANPNAIKIGLIMPLTGDSAAYGNDGLTATQIAADIFNSQGGVNGRMVQIVPANATTPDEAQAAAKRLITQDGIKILMGTTLSLLGIPASAEAERDGALYWDIIDVSPNISNRGLKHVFQLQPLASDSGAFGAQYIAQTIAPALGKTPAQLNVGVIYTNEALGTGTEKAPGGGLDEAKKQGLNVVVDQSYDPAITDLSSLVLKLKDANVDVILASTFQPDAILLNKTLRQLDFNPIVVDGLGYANPATVKALGDCINGVFLTASPPAKAINPDSLTPDGKAIYDLYFPAWEAKAGRPTSEDSDGDFAHVWALLKYVLPQAKNPDDIEELATIARGLDLPLGTLPDGFGVKFDSNQHNQLDHTLLSIDQYQAQKDVALFPALVKHGDITLVPRPAWSSICK